MDDSCCVVDIVVVRAGQFVHDGRVHPYSVGCGYCGSADPSYPGPQGLVKSKRTKENFMKLKLNALFIFSMFLIGQTWINTAQAANQVTAVQKAAKAINYRNLKGSVDIDFKGTVLLPNAKGTANVRNKAGETVIKTEFENLTAPSQFGIEYLTYVLWAISPDGRATNLGELIVKNGESRLNAQTSLQALSLIVTAEPYFAVSQPGSVVILENAIKPGNTDKIELVDAKYELLPAGEYTKNISATDIQPQAVDKKTPFYVYQARNAVRIAKNAGADIYAAEGFANAERLLALSETKEGGKKGRSMTAREAVQSAEDSRAIAVKRETDEALAKEQQKSKDQIAMANSQANAATLGQAQAEDARARAEVAKGQSDTERAAALALATSASGQADVANNRAKKAEGDQAVLRAQLLTQLNSILQTRDTARGLIVSMPDSLFQSGSSNLRPAVREKLAKIAGILSAHPDLKLSVEGHTDSVGSDEYNQGLSEQRAQAAKDYLVNQGVAGSSIASRGFGKTVPIATNDTPEGRQQNRRVELIVSGEAIGTSASAK